MDIGTLDTKTLSEAGSEVHLEHPATGEPLIGDDNTPVTITLLGDDADKIRKYYRRLNDARAERIKRGKDIDISTDKLGEEGCRKLALATVSWKGIELDGKALECTEENAFRLYMDPRFPWIVEQLFKAGSDRKRFFKPGSGN